MERSPSSLAAGSVSGGSKNYTSKADRRSRTIENLLARDFTRPSKSFFESAVPCAVVKDAFEVQSGCNYACTHRGDQKRSAADTRFVAYMTY